MDNNEKYIYNCYLETSRKLNDKPFRYRKDFEGFENTADYVCVNKLSRFFNKFPNIIIKDFFESPFFVYDEKYFDLQFYTSPKALKAYTIYQNTFIPNNPDHDQTIQKVKDSFHFIYNFCKSVGVSFEDYTKYKRDDQTFHSFLIHLKDRNICIYPLFLYSGVDIIIAGYDKEVKSFTFGDSLDKMTFYRTKYYASTRLKPISNIIFSKLKTL